MPQDNRRRRRSIENYQNDMSSHVPQRQHEHHHSPHRLSKTIFFWLLLSLVVFAIVGGKYLEKKLNNAQKAANTIYSSSNFSKSRNVSSTLKKGKPVSILLMGTDTGALGRDFRGRTDTLIVLVMNPKDKKMTLVSLPRDEKVAISGYEEYYPSKLNSAYFYGGSKAAVRTVQQDLNIPIDFYVTVNMGGLESIINAIGGVDVAPTISFSYGGYSFKKGKVTHMNGPKALAYVRMRHEDPLGDYGRQTRQRQVLMKVALKSSHISNLLNQKFLNTISKQMQTDLSFDDLLALGTKYRVATHGMDSDHLQGTSTMIMGESFEVPTLSEKQRITNKIRSALDLEKAKTGSTYGTDYEINTSQY